MSERPYRLFVLSWRGTRAGLLPAVGRVLQMVPLSSLVISQKWGLVDPQLRNFERLKLWFLQARLSSLRDGG